MKPSALSLFLLLCCAGTVGACNPKADEICHDRLPELEASLANALTVLQDWKEDNAGRALASLEPDGAPHAPHPEPQLSEIDRKSWEEWARVRLSETQGYIDQVP